MSAIVIGEDRVRVPRFMATELDFHRFHLPRYPSAVKLS